MPNIEKSDHSDGWQEQHAKKKKKKLYQNLERIKEVTWLIV